VSCSIEEQIKEAERELALRRNFYRKQVARQFMTEELAKYRIEVMEAIVTSLQLLRAPVPCTHCEEPHLHVEERLANEASASTAKELDMTNTNDTSMRLIAWLLLRYPAATVEAPEEFRTLLKEAVDLAVATGAAEHPVT
jgi:hypothetical protein